MYAKLMTRQSGSSSLNESPPLAPASPAPATCGLLPSVYHRLPISAAGSSTATTGR